MENEIWKKVIGFENYEVSNLGKIRRKIINGYKYLKGGKFNTGYACANFEKNGHQKKMLLHRVILMSFIGLPPDGMECLHIDGNRLNNVLSNLRWGTQKENMEDRERHGKTVFGEKVGTSVLKIQEVIEIRKLYGVGQSKKSLARIFKVHPVTIRQIIRNKSWKIT